MLGCQARLPVDLVAAPEGEVDAGVARRLDVGPLLPRPVFVMADAQEHLVVLDQAAEAVGIHAGHVGDVVAVLLQPLDGRVLDAEDVILRARPRGRRPGW